MFFFNNLENKEKKEEAKENTKKVEAGFVVIIPLTSMRGI